MNSWRGFDLFVRFLWSCAAYRNLEVGRVTTIFRLPPFRKLHVHDQGTRFSILGSHFIFARMSARFSHWNHFCIDNVHQSGRFTFC